jgi:hypothetical protein
MRRNNVGRAGLDFAIVGLAGSDFVSGMRHGKPVPRVPQVVPVIDVHEVISIALHRRCWPGHCIIIPMQPCVGDRLLELLYPPRCQGRSVTLATPSLQTFRTSQVRRGYFAFYK